MKVRELLSDPSKWTKGWFAYNAAGEEVDTKDPTAYCFCLLGAIDKCYPYGTEEYDEILRKVYSALAAKPIPYGSAATWNDSPLRTFAEVKALVDELDI